MNTIKLAVFDMAGTTVNEDNLVYKTVQKCINGLGFDVSLEEVLFHGAGKEKHKAITDVLTNCTDAKNSGQLADEAFANFKVELEAAYDKFPIKAFAKMDTFFSTLRHNGIRVVLNTGYDAKTANKLLDKLDWQVGRDIDALITADDVERGRPHPEMIELAMKKFNITDAKQVVKAGDSEIDIEEGKNACCGLTVAVLSGAQDRAQLALAQPDLILDKLTDLESYILK